MLKFNPKIDEAEEYLRKHRIIELFEDLSTALCFHQPKNVEEFLIDQLNCKKEKGFKTGIFSEEEIPYIFMLFDLKKDGSISKEICKEALKTMASSEAQYMHVSVEEDIPDKVDIHIFKDLW